MEENKKRGRTKEKSSSKSEMTNGNTRSASNNVTNFHSYASAAASDVEERASPNSATSTPEAKKGKTDLSLEDLQESILSKINESTDSLLSRIDRNDKSIRDITMKMQALFNEVKEVSDTVETLTQTTAAQEKHISDLEEKLNAQEAHHRRWNLRIYGLPEEKGEDLKKKVMDICRMVAPQVADMQLALDICHRVGPKKDRGPRPTLIRFAFRSVKEEVWRSAKGSDFLEARKIYFKLDLTAKDKERRNLLYPQVAAARREHKNAYYVGARAFIEGKEITL